MQMIIYVTDSRTLSNPVVTFSAWNNDNNQYYSDWEAVSGPLPGTGSGNRKNSTMVIYNQTSGDLLHQLSYNPTSSYSTVFISPNVGWYPHFADGQVKVHATINGQCYEDFENFATWNGTMLLQFNASSGATWNGSCRVGNFLRPYP